MAKLPINDPNPALRRPTLSGVRRFGTQMRGVLDDKVE